MNSPLDKISEEIGKPLGQAHALPFEAYRNEEVYQLEQQKIFREDWIFICASGQLPNIGDHLALNIAGEPIVVIRGKDGQLKALSNVCRHRGALLLDENIPANSTRIICPYHAWTYNDEGKLKGAPYTSKEEIDKEQHCLPQYALEEWYGFVFINLSKNPQPLEPKLSGLKRYLNLFDLKEYEYFQTAKTEHWKCNWKLAVENGIESYHLFKVHEKTLQEDAPTAKAYDLECQEKWFVTGGQLSEKQKSSWNWLAGDKKGLYENYLLVFMAPNMVGILAYGQFEWLSILPDGAKNCFIHSAGMYKQGGKGHSYSTDAPVEFIKEDQDICERVQRGIQTALSQGGKLTSKEMPVINFHSYLAHTMFGKEKANPQKHEQLEEFFKSMGE